MAYQCPEVKKAEGKDIAYNVNLNGANRRIEKHRKEVQQVEEPEQSSRPSWLLHCLPMKSKLVQKLMPPPGSGLEAEQGKTRSRDQ